MNVRNEVATLRRDAPWLLEPELATCVVGSAALAEACLRADLPPPNPGDLDLSWSLPVDQGRALLESKGVFMQTTDHNVDRGTLAFRHGDGRIEITSFRGGDREGTLKKQLHDDLAGRDMTIGALAWWLHHDTIVDPCGGLDHWRAGKIEAVGKPAERIDEHPVRWLRYYRKAHIFGFEVSGPIRKAADAQKGWLARIPREAVASEFRSALLDTPSPGRLFLDWHEAGLLAPLAPALALQFGSIPAGPQRYHPEVSQALHLILVLEWALEHTRQHGEDDRLAVLLAALCHDLGKGYTPPDEWPSHRGHEGDGVPHVTRFLNDLPGLSDARSRRLAEHVCALHLDARRMREMRRGTLVKLYERYFKARDYPIDLFALAIGADSGGRLGLQAHGDRDAAQVLSDLHWLRERCGSVDAGALRALHPDTQAFKEALHEARCQALRTP